MPKLKTETEIAPEIAKEAVNLTKNNPNAHSKKESKTAAKNTSKPLKTKDKVDEKVEKKVESYVPKITHWTKVKKEKQTDVDIVDEIDQSTEFTEINQVQTSQKEPIFQKSAKTTNPSTKIPMFSMSSKQPQEEINQEEIDQASSLQDKKVVHSNQPIDKLTQLRNQVQENTSSFGKFLKSDKSNKSVLPSFLNRAKSEHIDSVTQINNLKENTEGAIIGTASIAAGGAATGLSANAIKGGANSFVSNQENNSLTSIFKRDQDEIGNIKRVFRKSIMFLTLALLSFGLTSLASSSLGIQSILTLIVTSLGFIALTNIFFIIVAHRTYIWLFLIGEFIILAITQFPFSTNISTLLVGLATVLLTYLAYLDLEKVQLGSRLFSVPYIVGESTKILSSILILIVCLSVFNQINAKGLDKFLGSSVLDIPIVMDKIVLPTYQNVVAKGYNLDISDKGSTTLKSLVCADKKLLCYSKTNNVLSTDEYLKLNRQCEDSKLSDSDCLVERTKAEDVVLNNYLVQELPNMDLTLQTPLNTANYQPILSQIVQNNVKKSTDSINNTLNNVLDPAKFGSFGSSLPTKNIVPFLITVILFILLTIFKFILTWLGYIVTWVLWKLLQVTGFVRLDIEMVEAEIVGI